MDWKIVHEIRRQKYKKPSQLTSKRVRDLVLNNTPSKLAAKVVDLEHALEYVQEMVDDIENMAWESLKRGEAEKKVEKWLT